LKGPRRPEEIFEEFSNDCREAFGEALRSIVLYGSGASADYRPERSDVNFLIVLSEEGIRALNACFKLVGKWRARRVATPLVMTEQCIVSSLDSFPLEFLNIRHQYSVVWGHDPLVAVRIDPEKLRLQCEREVKGKLVQLRGAYVASEGRKRELLGMVTQSITAFVSIFRGILYLCQGEVPVHRGAVIARVADTTGVDEVVFLRLVQIKEGKVKVGPAELHAHVIRYLDEVRKLAVWWDAFDCGVRERG